MQDTCSVIEHSQMPGFTEAFVPYRLLRAVAPLHGRIVNISSLCRSLSASRRLVRTYLRRLASDAWIGFLSPVPEPRPPEIILKDHLYLASRAWPHVLGIDPKKQKRAYNREPLLDLLLPRTVEQVARREYDTKRRRRSATTTRLYSMRRYRQRGVDLVIVRKERRIGINFEAHAQGREYSLARRALAEAKERGWIDRAFLLTCEPEAGMAHGEVIVLPAVLFLAYYWVWTGYTRWKTPRELLRLYETEIWGKHGFWHPSDPPQETLAVEDQTRIVRRMHQLLSRPP